MYGDYGGRSSGPVENIRRFFLRGGIPVTYGLMAANAFTFFLFLTGSSGFLLRYLAFSTDNWPGLFWTFLTWPLVGADSPLGLIFSLGWVYTFGGSLERSWGSRVYGICVFAVSALMAISLWIGSHLPGVGAGGLAGLWVLAGAITVAWALINRSEVVNLLFLPLPSPVLLLVGCAITWYHAGLGLQGVFALSGCAAAWWYATNGRYGSGPSFGGGRGKQRRPGSVNDRPNLRFANFEQETRDGGSRRGFNLARWWRERKEKKRLEDMFRRSGYTDPEERRKK